MALLDVFFGVPQSKYAGLAIIASLLAVAVAILFGKDTVPMGQKFASILLMFLIALPGLLLTLFQLTCLVTGVDGGKKWWCGVYAWIGTVLLFLYALVVVVVAVLAISKGSDVVADLTALEQFEAEQKKDEANKAASAILASTEGPAAPAAHAAAPTPKVVPAVPAAPSASVPTTKATASGVSTFEDQKPPLLDQALGGAAPDDEVAASEPETFTTCGAPLQF